MCATTSGLLIEMSLTNLLPRLASNQDFLNLSLLGSWDYSYEPHTWQNMYFHIIEYHLAIKME
jgi:hypothetical protein